MISVLILTLNENKNLPMCLSSLGWCNDIVILDSYSSDDTVEIAKKYNCRIHKRHFDDFAAQRNYGLHEIDYKNPWVLMLDADERTTPELVEEIQEVIKKADLETVMFRMKRKDHLFGTWLRRANAYPTWFGRLVRPEKVRVARTVNEEYLADGKIGHLKHHLLHHSYNAGFASWLITQNRHSSMEAEMMVTSKTIEPLSIRGLLSGDPTIHRKTMKQIAFRLPARPLIVFFYWYLLRGGFVEGKAGFTHCVLRSFYEYILNLKVKELKRRKKSLPI